MYPVTESYLNQMRSPVIRTKMTGKIGNITFMDYNILEGSFTITNQCSGNEQIQIGQVYTAELKATFLKNLSLSRYSLKNKKITPSHGLMLPDKTYEYVPLGVFNIEEAEWSASGVTVTAYDNMSKLDRTCSINSAIGKPVELAAMACNHCGVELGTTSAEFSHFANGSTTLSMYPENDIETWRDFISWVAQTVGCNVMADREGKIIFRAYGQTLADTLEPNHRLEGGQFSDFVTRYTGLSCVNMDEKTTSYYKLELDDGLTYNLGSNPFLQYGVEAALTVQRRAVLYALRQIQYVPFKADLIGVPIYDLMDVISFPDGIGDSDQLFCITKYVFTHHGTYSMTGVGQNPALASAKSKTDKDIAGLNAQKENEGMRYAVYTNVDDVTIADGHTEKVVEIEFTVVKKTHCQILIEILVDAETTETGSEGEWVENDAVCTATYYLNDEEILQHIPVETWQDGRHILSLTYDLQAVAAQIHKWEVWLTMAGGQISMGKYDILCVIAGEGLSSESEWDGIIRGSDKIHRINFYPMFRGIGETVQVGTHTPISDTASDSILINYFRGMFKGMSDTREIAELHRFSVPYTAQDMTTTNVTWDGEIWYNTDSTIDGTVATPDCEVPRLLKVTSNRSPNSGDVTYLASFDSGATWYTYSGGWVQHTSGYGMVEGVLESITREAWGTKITNGTVMIMAQLQADATLTDIQIYTAAFDDSDTVEPLDAVSYSSRYVSISRDYLKLIYDYLYSSSSNSIDVGQLEKLAIESNDYSRIDSITVRE